MSLHMGRAWTGHAVEDACACPKAPCGLAMPDGQPFGACDQHNPADPLFARTMRQIHTDAHCPAALEAGRDA